MEKVISVLGGYLAVMTGTIIGLWRRVSVMEGIKVSSKTCSSNHNHQTTINTDLIERITRVETKIDLGFKNLSDKIDRNGKKYN